jgi:hypothetical protein
MIDAESMVHHLLTGRFPGIHVSPDIPTDITLPAVVYAVTGDGQVSNGPGLFSLRLEYTTIGSVKESWGLASDVYDFIRTWPGTSTPFGNITSIYDFSIPTVKEWTEMASKAIKQYQGSCAFKARTPRP